MSEIISSILLILGFLLVLIGAIGLVRLPDLYNRMHATTISSTLGIVSILIGTTVHFSNVGQGMFLKLLLAVVFLYLSAPVGAFMIARASYVVGVPLTNDTIKDDLKTEHSTVPEME